MSVTSVKRKSSSLFRWRESYLGNKPVFLLFLIAPLEEEQLNLIAEFGKRSWTYTVSVFLCGVQPPAGTHLLLTWAVFPHDVVWWSRHWVGKSV